MRADDLMIGDLVYYSYPNQFVTKVIDVCSHGEEHFIRCKRDEKDNLYKQDQLEDFHVGILNPIVLTEEILKKNGFLEDSNGIFYLKEYLKFGFKKDVDYGYWFINRADNYKEYICTCDFVHELQHILKLCKIEKEIVL